MKTEKNILIAFILNLAFSVFEFFGGAFTNSVAIMSDAVHDMGDALSIGIAYFLERKSKKQPDETYTFGYARYSVVGSVITTLILLVGCIAVAGNAIKRIIVPAEINYNGMMIFALIGAAINFAAALITKDGDSLNQKAVNLHMLEDVLGWIVVLIGAVVMRVTDLAIIDPILSIGVAAFIFINAIKNLKAVLDLFLEKAPQGISVSEIKEDLCKLDGIEDVHHIHLWSMDGQSNFATMHIVSDSDESQVKARVREHLRHHNICHATLEIEKSGEKCEEMFCQIESASHHHHHHHHH